VVFVQTLGGGPPIFNWAVAGLDPGSRGLSPGALPPTAITGRNSFGRIGYELCPTATAPRLIGIVVVAVPRDLKLHQGFDAATLLRELLKPGSRHGGIGMTSPPTSAKAGAHG